jgi:hypothetical protein
MIPFRESDVTKKRFQRLSMCFKLYQPTPIEWKEFITTTINSNCMERE